MNRSTVLAISLILLAAHGAGARGIEAYPFRGAFSDHGDPPAFHRFSGGKVVLPLALSWEASSKASFSADLFQTSFGLAIPIEKEIKITSDLSLPPGAFTRLDVSVDLPEVKAASSFLLKLVARSDSTQDSLPLMIHAHPPLKNIQKELKKLLESAEEKREVRVRVFGKDNPFRPILEQSGADFIEGGEDIPSDWNEEKILFIGSVTGEEATEIFTDRGHRLPASIHLILFIHDDISLFPGIYPQPPTHNGARTKIHLPELAQIDDPRTWETCLHLLQDHLKRI